MHKAVLSSSNSLFSGSRHSTLQDYRQLQGFAGREWPQINHRQSYLSECIPVVHSMYVKQVSAELEGVPVSIIFDGSTRLGEAFALVVKFVTTDLKICQRLLSLKCVAKSMSASDVSGLLVDVLMENFHLSRRNIFAAMRDGASVNVAALANLKQVFPTIIDITCFSHTLVRAGQYFNTPNSTEFVNSWISLFAYSFKARLAFKEKTGMNPKLLSKTRWWVVEVGSHKADR